MTPAATGHARRSRRAPSTTAATSRARRRRSRVNVTGARPARARSGTTRVTRRPSDNDTNAIEVGREVPLRRRRLHHRASVLQGRRQHRHARRAPVDGRRDPARHRRPSRARPPSGWQQVTLRHARSRSTPSTTYVASYHAPTATTPSISDYFATAGVDNPPLHALADGVDGPERRLHVRAVGGVPDRTAPSGRATTGSTSSSTPRSARHDAADGHLARAGAGRDGRRAHAPRAPRPSTSRWTPARSTARRSSCATPANALVPATVTYDAAQRTATLDPTAALHALRPRYTATVTGGAGGVKDLAGNALGRRRRRGRSRRRPRRRRRRRGRADRSSSISSTGDPFGRYYAEILRAEGLNEFTVTDICARRRRHAARYDVVILGEMPLTPAQATMFDDWVTAGGNLIAMRPDSTSRACSV